MVRDQVPLELAKCANHRVPITSLIYRSVAGQVDRQRAESAIIKSKRIIEEGLA
jgi:hypothetical protein